MSVSLKYFNGDVYVFIKIFLGGDDYWRFLDDDFCILGILDAYTFGYLIYFFVFF